MSLNQNPFLSNTNYQKVVGFLRQHYATRMGTNSIPERTDSRIQRTVQHFMTEVAKIQGSNKPLNLLNQEVIRESSKSLDQWLGKQEPMRQPPPMAAIPPVLPKTATVSTASVARQRVPATPTGVPQSAYDDISALFTSPEVKWDSVEEEDEDPVILMKKAQKQRESEMQRTPPRMEVQENIPTNSVDPTPQAQPPPIRTVPLPQDYIIPQEPVVKYREVEYNIFITSSDRDWFRNRAENRYNFSVSFNPGNRTGYGYSPAIQERFRNIERIEFVKLLAPTESLTPLIRSTAKSATPGTLTTNADRVVNVMSLPFTGVRIAELNNNGFSTNPREDNTFAMLQYDATWNSAIALNVAAPSSTSLARTNVGYTAMIPKFLKAQRIYEPTPLAGLQKMSFRVERHDGALLSNDSDVFSIDRICLSSNIYSGGGIAATDNTNYAGSDNEYIYIQTAAYFPYSAVAEGDLINVQGYVPAPAGTAAPAVGTLTDFENYINTPGSLNVVAIAYVAGSGGASTLSEGVNAQGYANVIIVRSRFADPTTGSVARSYFGGSSTEEGYLEQRIRDQASTASTTALLNLSRQTHFVLRVITRDMDSASNIRPDNV